MVTENQEPQAVPSVDPPEESAPAPENPILSEVDSLNNAPEVDTSEPVAETPAQAPAAPASPEPAPTPPEGSPEATQYNPQQVAELQRQAQEYESVRQRAQMQQESQRYQQQLESKGYMPEQAEEAAKQYTQTRQVQQNLMKKADEYGQMIMAKTAAAEHFAQKYKLDMSSLAILRQADSAEVMEEMAKKVAEDRNLRAELNQLRQAQVPPQRFDDSQGEPQVAANDGSWLDRYNAGDRSSSALAAARRAVGLN